MENLIGNDNNILDVITDEITLESANSINEEYIHIINTYDVMEKVINVMAKPETITTESGVNTFDNFVVEQLATVGLTKEYFGFEDELTVETAQVTIEVDDRWSKLWEWLKAKLVQLKDWLARVYKALFNKNKTLLQTIVNLENIKLDTKVQTKINNTSFASFITYLPDFSKSLMLYTTGLEGNYSNYTRVIETIIKDDINLPKCINELRSSSTFKHVSDIAVVLGHSVYSVKGLLVNVYDEKAKYITMDGSAANKIVGSTFVISNIAKINGAADTLEPSSIKFILSTLKTLATNLDKNMPSEAKKLESVLTVYTDSIKINSEAIGDTLKAVVDIILGRQTNINFTVNEVTKLVKAIALHIKCYK